MGETKVSNLNRKFIGCSDPFKADEIDLHSPATNGPGQEVDAERKCPNQQMRQSIPCYLLVYLPQMYPKEEIKTVSKLPNLQLQTNLDCQLPVFYRHQYITQYKMECVPRSYHHYLPVATGTQISVYLERKLLVHLTKHREEFF